MKKLICAAVVAGSMFVMAEETAEVEAPTAPATAEAVKVAPKRVKMSSDEQHQKMREMAEKRRAEFVAKKEAQILEVVKKYVPEEEKAKALVKELRETMMSGRRNMMMRRPPKAPAAKPTEAK